MSAKACAADEARADNHTGVKAELTTEFSPYWFADEFEVGDDLLFRVAGEVNHATVTATEPADGAMVVDTSDFDRDSHQTQFAIADRSSTGPDYISHDFLHGIRAVPTDSPAAEHDAETTHVVCECGTISKAGRGHSIHRAKAHDNSNDSDKDEGDNEPLPHPNEDPTIAYVHEGKRYEVAGGVTFEIVKYDPHTLPELDGVVIIEADDGARLNSEHQHQNGGVSRDVLEPHIPDDGSRAVWTATGLLSSLRRLEILEKDPASYRDYYWNRQDVIA